MSRTWARRSAPGALRTQITERLLTQPAEIRRPQTGIDLALATHVYRPLASSIAIAALLGACGDNLAGSSIDAAPPEIEGQGSEPTGALIINEVSPRGPGADWIEIANVSDSAIDLCDFFVSDSFDRLDHYHPLGGSAPPDPCTPELLEPGALLVIEADDDLGAPFQLGVADEVHIIGTDGKASDSLVYLHRDPTAGDTLARQPDRSGLFFPAAPTRGEANR